MEGQAPAKHHLQCPTARTVRDSVHAGASRHQRHPIGVCKPNEAYYILRLFPVQIVVGSLAPEEPITETYTHGGSSVP